MSDNVNHPPHYTSHPSGVECIQVAEHMGYTLGNVIKYVWRADLKGDAVEDLRKAEFYLRREIANRMGVGSKSDREKVLAFADALRAVPIPNVENNWVRNQMEEIIEHIIGEVGELAQSVK